MVVFYKEGIIPQWSAIAKISCLVICSLEMGQKPIMVSPRSLAVAEASPFCIWNNHQAFNHMQVILV